MPLTSVVQSTVIQKQGSHLEEGRKHYGRPIQICGVVPPSASPSRMRQIIQHLVPFTFSGDFIGAWKESTVMSSELVPAAVVVVRHHQQVVDVPAQCSNQTFCQTQIAHSQPRNRQHNSTLQRRRCLLLCAASSSDVCVLLLQNYRL